MMPTDPDPKVDNRFRWLPTAAKHYHLHKEQGTSIRTIVRSLGCHASTVSRQVRRIERMRDDPAVKATLDKLKHVQLLKSTQQPHKSEPEDARILRLLGTKGAVLVLAENMHKALIMCEEPPPNRHTNWQGFGRSGASSGNAGRTKMCVLGKAIPVYFGIELNVSFGAGHAIQICR